MLQNLLHRTRRKTWILLTAVAIVCPVFYYYVDLPIAVYLRNSTPRFIQQAARNTTGAGDWILGLFLIIAFVGRFVCHCKRVLRIFLFPLLSAAVAGLLASVLKVIVGRWRPKAYFGEGAHYGCNPFHVIHSSWPSGHSAAIMATLAAIIIFFPKWRIPCFAAALWVGLTRMILAAHFSGDVFAGLVLGYLCTHGLYYLLVRGKHLPEPEMPGSTDADVLVFANRLSASGLSFSAHVSVPVTGRSHFSDDGSTMETQTRPDSEAGVSVAPFPGGSTGRRVTVPAALRSASSRS
jgi:membrane-associated phospholipid phosphatase